MPRTRLRLLQTTDLHMHLLPYDYERLQVAERRGLTALRDDIDRLRGEDGICLLVDTGDFLQGTPLADAAIAADGPHPMIAAFNDLRYDAVVLGNHDFDYGVAPLRRALRDLDCPVLAGNLTSASAQPFYQATTLVVQEVDGQPLCIGLVGLTAPPPPTVMDRSGQDSVAFSDVVPVAQQAVEALRAEGADVVIALCHFGIDPDDQVENVADRVAQVVGIDAVLMGHTHDQFPGSDIPASPGIDPVRGELHGIPAVMGPAFGQGLGLIDLMLEHRSDGWTIVSSNSAVVTPDRTPVPHVVPVPGLLKLHEDTLTAMKAPLAQTQAPIATVFSMVAPDLGQALLARSRMAWVHQALSDTQYRDLPVIGVAAPHRAGTKDAPFEYLNVAPGPITAHDTLGIFPFQDPVIGVLQSGADIRSWLEQTAARFQQITPGQTDQILLDPGFAPYNFKTLFGLKYRFDLSRVEGERVVALTHQSEQIEPEQMFVVATTPISRRAARGSGPSDVLCTSDETSQSLLRGYLKELGTVRHEVPDVWDFAPLDGATARFVTARDPYGLPTNRNVTAGAPIGDALQRFMLTFE